LNELSFGVHSVVIVFCSSSRLSSAGHFPAIYGLLKGRYRPAAGLLEGRINAIIYKLDLIKNKISFGAIELRMTEFPFFLERNVSIR
jgi:hypothetical protein